MIFKKLLSLLPVLLLALSARAAMDQYSDKQAKHYIEQLTKAGVGQRNYIEFQKQIELLKANGYEIDTVRAITFSAEILEQRKLDNEHLEDRMGFKITIPFTGKVEVINGKRHLIIPHLSANGDFTEVCDAKDTNCAPATRIYFSSYELGYLDIPEIGGGTSSAGSK